MDAAAPSLPPGPADRAWRWAFVCLAVAFLLVATLYNVTTPIFEAPDELQHVAYIVWLADEKALPAIDLESVGPWMQEGTQPPLYYWIVSLLVGNIPHRTADQLATQNPHAAIGIPLRPGNKNYVLHDLEGEQWPYSGTALLVHLARGLSTLMALGTLAAVYRLGTLVFPERRGIALGMVALVGFTPQFLFISGAVNNDNLVILLTSWAVVLLASWLCAPRLPSWPSSIALGVLMGAAVLAKASGLLLFPLAAGAIAWLAWRHRRLDLLVPWGLLVAAVALAACGWWMLRNQRLYGDLSGIQIHLQLMGTRPRLPPTAEGVLGEFNGFRYSSWGLFGWFNVISPEPFYRIVELLTVAGLVGAAVYVLRARRSWSLRARRGLALAGSWMALVYAGFLQWTLRTPASQGRLVFPALPAIALILVVGLAELIPRRLRAGAAIVALACWVTWAALIPSLVIRPAYALPERVQTPDQLPVTPAALDARFDACCELVGAVPPDTPVHPGDWVELTLVWRAIEPVSQDYSVFVHATTPGGQAAGQLDTYPGSGMYPTSQWRPGELLVDRVSVQISWQAPAPSLVRFRVGLYDLDTMQQLPAFSATGSALETVVAGEAAILPFQWPAARSDPSISTLFEDQVRLSAADLPPPALHAGDLVTVTLQWQALETLQEDYTGFVHLVDASGDQEIQDDHPPLEGGFPTRLWPQGAVVEDLYQLALPASLEAGSYELFAGLYRPGSSGRLAAVSEATGERWLHDLVPLGSLVVEPGER